jgi:hypothetical protein
MQIEINQKLPTKLKLLLCYRKTPTLVALVVLFISGVICISNLHDFDFREYNKLRKNTKQATATITNAYYTGISGTIGDDEGTYYINAFEYEYVVKGETHKWTSYSRNSNKKAGDKAFIKYNIHSPQYSVINGYDYRPHGTSVLLLLIFPLISLIILLYHIYKGIIFYDIIKTGIITSGKVTKRKVIHDGDSGTYTKLTFSYNSDTKKNHETSITTSNTHPYLKRGGKQYIIFKKSSPKNALVLNNLSSKVITYVQKNWIK